jgi:hypothetical protein
LIAIDGVLIHPPENKWWVCRLNGSKKVSPHRTKLKAGDRVEWIYIAQEQ